MKLYAPLALILLASCSQASAPPAANDIAPTPLTYMSPDDSLDNIDSDVAPYVLARGAGPSQISPDGRTVVTRLSLTGTRQLYAIEALADDPQSTLRQLTNGSGVTFFDIAPDGRLIYGSDNNGDERENYWLLDISAEVAAPRLLLPATVNGFRSYGGFSGDSKTLVYASTERSGLDYDIYAADVESGETRRVFEGRYGNYVQAVAPDGSTAIISEAVGEDSDKLFLLDLSTGERSVLSDPVVERGHRANHVDAGVYFADDARHILMATNRGSEFAQITRILQPGRTPGILPEPDVLASAEGLDIDSLVPCADGLLYTINADGFSITRYLAEPGTPNAVPREISGLPSGVHSLDCSGDRALVRISAPDIPGDLYSVDLDTLVSKRIFASDFGELDPDFLVSPTSVRLLARDGVEVQGLLYLPEISAKPPVVFMVHGGPTAQSRPSYNATAQYLLSRGIAVFQPNVRGSTGFGRTYTTLDDQRKRTDSVRDLVDMLAWLEEDGRVDTSRAAVMGGSYGGYVVNAVLAEYPDAFDAGVSLFGVGDWVTALEVASPALKASDIIEYGDISDPEVRAFHASISPVAKADNIRVPVLYSHGVMDPRIDIAETEIMVRALRDNGIRADYVRIPDEGHGWRKLNNRLYYERIQADFLEDVLR